jgi:hypothetical protein
MSTTFETRDDFAALRPALEDLQRIVALPAEVAELRRPEQSGWSALEHVAHVSLANELIVRNLHGLASGQGLLLQQDGEPAAGALEVLESGVIPRGRAQSPRMVRPPARIDRALLAEWMKTAEVGFEHFSARVELLELATGRIPHQLLGPLTAPQWVRFARIHTLHHLAIADTLLKA